jgi:glycerophosphoryl diester phosphodiesterase
LARNRAKTQKIDWLIGPPIAHRGLHGPGIIENTLAAFAAAIAAGYAIELDVRASADGEAFVFHDARLDRLTKRSGVFAEQSTATLRALDIPTLADVLALVRGRVPLFIEVKADGKRDPRLAARLHHLLRAYAGPLAVQSFSPAIIAWFAREAPWLTRGLLAGDERAHLTAVLHQSHFIGYHVQSLPLPGAGPIQRLGLPILAWTVNDAKTRSIARAYADNIFFEGFRPGLRE